MIVDTQQKIDLTREELEAAAKEYIRRKLSDEGVHPESICLFEGQMLPTVTFVCNKTEEL